MGLLQETPTARPHPLTSTFGAYDWPEDAQRHIMAALLAVDRLVYYTAYYMNKQTEHHTANIC